jgi:hypothetical protein
MNLFHFFSKKASRKNLYKLINSNINIIKTKNKKIRLLNIGAGGEIEDIIKKKINYYYSIDINSKRNPNQIIDICDKKFLKKIKFKPNLIFMFEVLEHTKKPEIAIKNIYNILKKGEYCLASVPFNFHLHDEPNDFYRFTKYGLELLFNSFSKVQIINRNGWLDSIFVNLIRLEKENYLLSKVTGKLFIIIYFLLYPLIQLLQKIIISDKITTGYFVVAIK